MHHNKLAAVIPRKEAIAYGDPFKANADFIGQEELDIRRKMGPEEGTRHNTQLQAQQCKMVEIGRQALALQAIPIGNPDPAPKWQYQKKEGTRKSGRSRPDLGRDC